MQLCRHVRHLATIDWFAMGIDNVAEFTLDEHCACVSIVAMFKGSSTASSDSRWENGRPSSIRRVSRVAGFPLGVDSAI